MKLSQLLLTAVLVSIGISGPAIARDSDIQVYQTRGDFADVRQNLIDAIVNRGYVIDFNGRVGDMLKRTRADVGGKPIYKNAEYLVFCSATLSRDTMEENKHNIGFCPYSVTVYESVDDTGNINVAYRKLKGKHGANGSLMAVEKMLDEVAREATE